MTTTTKTQQEAEEKGEKKYSPTLPRSYRAAG